MKQKFRKLLSHDSFFKASSIIVICNILSQFFNLLIQPILSRFFTPTEFGEYAIFIATVSLVCIFFYYTYDQAIISSNDKDESQILFVASLYLASFVLLTLLLLTSIFKMTIADYIHIKDVSVIYLMLINSYFLSVVYILVGINYKNDNYGRIGLSSIVRIIGVGIIQLILLFTIKTGYDLAYGNTIALVFCSYFLFDKNLINFKFFFLPKSVYIKVLKKYYTFPMFQAPASFVDHFSDSVLAYAILFIGNAHDLGIYSLVSRILSIPISVVSKSVQQLCIHRFSCSNIYNTKEFFFKLSFSLLFIITIPLIVLSSFGEYIVVFLFGEQWVGSGSFITALTPVFIAKFVSYPISGLIVSRKKQCFLFFINIMIIVCILCSMYITYAFNKDVRLFLFIQSIMISFLYAIQILYSYKNI